MVKSTNHCDPVYVTFEDKQVEEQCYPFRHLLKIDDKSQRAFPNFEGVAERVRAAILALGCFDLRIEELKVIGESRQENVNQF